MRLLLIFLLFSCTLSAQLTPEAAIAAMGRGINLGNTLEPPTEGAWNNGPAQESYFDRYVEAGFTNVRIPVRWDQHTANTPPYAINDTWMDRVEQVVDWALERDLYVTLNGHHEDWLKNNYSAANQARYDSIWVQIIARFQHKSDKLLYEIINEPNGLSVAQVDDLNARILGIIRATEPTRLVIYGGNMYSNAEQLYDAAIPDDDYIIGYFHSYDPWQFAGQATRDWGTSFDYQQLSNKLASAAGWSLANGVPIHISEFGAIHENDYNSRMRYYAHYVDQLQFHGFAWSVWDDGGMFGVLNRNAGTWPEVKDILVHTHNDAPYRFEATPERDENDNPVVDISWVNRSGDGQNIRVQRLSGTTFTDLATVPAGTTTYQDTDVILGGTYTYRVITQRADGTPLHGYPQRVFLTTSVQTSFTGTPIAIPGVVETSDYDLGGEGLAYHDQDAANIPGGYRPAEGVDLEPNGSGGFHIGYVNPGEWVEYTVDVAEAGTYSVSGEIASEVSGGAFEISFPDGATIGLSDIVATGGWTTHQEMDLPGTITLAAGTQVMRVSITGAQPFNLDFLTFTLETSSAEEAAIAAGFTFAPNPVRTMLEVQVPLGYWSGTTPSLELVSSYGQVLRRYATTSPNLALNISDLPAGVYLLRMSSGNKQLIRRLIKK